MPSATSGFGTGPKLFRYVDSLEFSVKPFVVSSQDTLTYGALRERMARTAQLFANFDIQLGDRIVICSEHEIEVIVLYLAAMRAGVTPALIDPNSSAEERMVLVRAARARALFADVEKIATASFENELLAGGRIFRVDRGRPRRGSVLESPEVKPDPLTYPALLADIEPLPVLPESIPDETSAFILFTSGTTSRPKGVEASHRAVTEHMMTMHGQYGYGEESVILNGLPLHHSDGINHGAVNVMAAGGTLYRTGSFSVQQLPKVLGLIARAKITHMITVPTVLALVSRMGEEYTDAFRTPTFRFVSSTAGPLDERLWRTFEDRFGTMIVNSYGLTETVCEGFYCGPTTSTRRVGTIGKPIDIEVRIVDADDREVELGTMGELVLRGSCVMKGYYNAPEETAAVLREGWLHTGDLAVRDLDGFYSITGRKKNVIITGGVNVYPEDVSRTIQQIPGVLEAVTVGIADETWGERVVSCVVAERLGGPVIEQVINYCRIHMSQEKVPSHVFLLDELPRGPSGKVALPEVRRIVSEMLAAEVARHGAATTQVDGVAQRVMELAARSFNTSVSDLSLDSEPETTAGWNSLAHMDFLLSLEATFGLQISPHDMLAIETLGDAIEYVRDAVPEAKADR